MGCKNFIEIFESNFIHSSRFLQWPCMKCILGKRDINLSPYAFHMLYIHTYNIFTYMHEHHDIMIAMRLEPSYIAIPDGN